jgi:hypothetical protein
MYIINVKAKAPDHPRVIGAFFLLNQMTMKGGNESGLIGQQEEVR